MTMAGTSSADGPPVAEGGAGVVAGPFVVDGVVVLGAVEVGSV